MEWWIIGGVVGAFVFIDILCLLKVKSNADEIAEQAFAEYLEELYKCDGDQND